MKRIPRLAALYLVMVGSMARAASPIDPANPPEGTFVDEWYVLQMDGNRAGHMHSTVTRKGNHITTHGDMNLAIRRGDAEVKIGIAQSTRELLDGTPVGFENTLTMGTMPMRSVGRIRKGVLTLRDEQMGKKTTREFPFDMSVRLAWGMYLEQQKHGFKPGETYSIKSYDSSLRPDAPFLTRVEVIGPDAIDMEGKRVQAVKVRQTIVLDAGKAAAASQSADKQPAGGLGAAAAQMMGGELTSTAWVDGDGQILRMDTNIGGMFSIRMFRTTREAALAETGKSAELFLSTLIPVKAPINPKAKRIVYRLTTKDGGPLPDLPETSMQHFKRIDARTGLLTVRRIDWPGLRGKGVQSKGAEGDIYMKASLMADANDPRIRALAKEAVADEKEWTRRADKLRRFVSKYIVTKNMNVGFASASEVAQSREGDCSEHAVLLAAMCRAAGLPSRGVAGIVRVPDDGPTQFGYHMWTQVRIGGVWADIDAALAQSDCDPTHIALSIMDLNDAGIAEAGMAMLPMLGRLRLEVVPPGAKP